MPPYGAKITLPDLFFIHPHFSAAGSNGGQNQARERERALLSQKNKDQLTASQDLIRYLTNPQSYSFVHGWRLEG